MTFVALIISIISLIWTILNQRGQNFRWAKLNAPNLGIREIKMLPFREVSRHEAEKIDWGYKPNIYSTDRLDRFVLPYFLSVRDSFGNVISDINPSHTFKELENELKRIGYKNQIHVGKQFRPSLIIENFGKTSVSELSIKIERDNNGIAECVFESNTKISLLPNNAISINFDIEIPIITPSDFSPLNFTLLLTYLDFNNKRENKKIGTKWSETDNSWFYSSI
jgi:hypothetical protein